MKPEPIQEFILKDEKTFGIAAEVASAWEQLPTLIARDFLDRLVARFLAKKPGWASEPYQQFFVDAYANIAFWKPAWEGQYWICLEAQSFGKNIKFGVARDEDQIKNRAFCAELLAAIQQIHTSARAVKWWEAAITMRSPAIDWTKPEVLWRMHTDEAFLKDVLDQLLEVADTSEHFLDEQAKVK